MDIHQTVLTRHDKAGNQLWECRECSRVILLTYNQDGTLANREVVIAGDTSVGHTGNHSADPRFGVQVNEMTQSFPPKKRTLREILKNWVL